MSRIFAPHLLFASIIEISGSAASSPIFRAHLFDQLLSDALRFLIMDPPLYENFTKPYLLHLGFHFNQF